MAPHLLLVAQEGPALEAYRRLLGPANAQCDIVANLAAAHTALSANAYHALLVDMVTMVRAPQAEKAELHEALSLYPVVRLKYEHDRGQVQAVYMGRAGGEQVDLIEFIQVRCPEFKPRRVRRHERTDYHLNVVLAGDALFTPDTAQRTNILNVSESGCFVYSVWDWPLGTPIWLQITDLADDSPVTGTVVRRVHWGTPGLLPGIGVQFAQITPAQVAEIKILRRNHSA
jgi:hypothetical protein